MFSSPIPRNDGKFGYFGFSPSWLQWLNNPWFFLSGIFVLTFGQATALTGLLVMLMPQIEKRFNLSGFDSGMIFAANDMAAIVVGLLVSHYGSFGRKTKWIGFGGLITGLGFFIFSMPHYIIGRYQPPAATVPQLFCFPRPIMTQQNNGTADTGETCVGEIAAWYYLALFLNGQFIAGVGSVALYSFTPGCFEEMAGLERLPIFIGIWQLSVFVGPTFAFLVSKPLLKSYVDITQPEGIDMEPNDPRWISNWWIGFVICSVLCVLSSLFILGFPAEKKPSVTASDSEMHEDNKMKCLKEKLAEFPSRMKLLLCNWSFLANCMGINSVLMFIEGLSPFLAKMLMLNFGVDPVNIGDALTISSGPPLALGTFVGILLTKRLKFEESGKRSALYCLIAQILIMIGPLSLFLPGCDIINLAGWQVPYGARYMTSGGVNITEYPAIPDVTLGSTCNQFCGCNLGIAMPVCGSDNITYLSPCYAGCTTPLSMTKFGNCSCVGPDNGYGGTVSIGFCERGCKNWVLFLTLLGVAALFVYIQLTPVKVVVMRCVRPENMSLAFGMQYMLTKVFAHVPGPILFGHLVDINCEIWQKVCDKTGFCWIYDVKKKVKILTIASILSCASGVLFYFLSWYFYKEHGQDNPQLTKYEEKKDGDEDVADTFI